MATGENDGDLTGRLLGGRYRVTGPLGRGGMGMVCRAVDDVLGREVAVKILRTWADAAAPELAELGSRMRREARAAARIRHAGVITVHDVIEEAGRPVIVMELVDGPSLDDVLGEQGVLDPVRVAGIGAAVADALDAAHRAGVLHRDVKPGNILLDRGGRVVLTDFGIASVDTPGEGMDARLTRSGELVGSLDYLPPERAAGQHPGPASDIWSLGMTLYAAVEETSPFRRASVWLTLNAIVTEELPEPRRAGPLAAVLREMTRKDPAARPSAARVRELLAEVADAAGTTGRAAAGGATATAEGPAPAGLPAADGPAPTASAGTVAPGTVAPGIVAAGTAAPGAAASAPAAPGAVPGDRPGARAGAETVPSVTGPPPAAVPFTPPGPVPPPTPYAPAATPALAAPPTGPLPGPPGARPYQPAPLTGRGPQPTAAVPAARSGGRRRLAVPVAVAAAVLLAGGGVGLALSGGSGHDDTGGQPLTLPSLPGAASRPASAPARATAHRHPSATAPPTAAHGSSASAGATAPAAPHTSAPARPAPRPTTAPPPPPKQPAPVCDGIGGGKYDCHVWRDAASYDGAGNRKGILHSGTNYFYCQQNLGRRETYGSWTNVWWARTDDDSGNTNVWVSDVYISGGDNDQPVPGLPSC